MFFDLIQNTLDGLAMGSSYALLAVGFTLIFGVLRRVNLSYGPAIMFGGYCATWVHLNFQAGLLALAIITIAGAVLAGAYVERLCFAPHRQGSAIAAMVASFALWMQFEEAVTLVMPSHVYDFPAMYDGPPFEFGSLTLRMEALVMLACAVAISYGLHRVLSGSRFGLAVRAVIDSPVAAQLAGIDVPRVLLQVFLLASSIGGLAGYLIVSTHTQITPMLGMWSTLKGLLAMMIGGLGSLPGAVAGGLVLGVLEAHSQWFLGPQSRDLLAFLLLFGLLAVRPYGLWRASSAEAEA
ncbi:MAG: branched-chain amino acid ABC transporter permease [Betaproteobacteria bacterium]|nr:branched-chain amino acid ABC transporter permease [Betaproteobacteria bacterium]